MRLLAILALLTLPACSAAEWRKGMSAMGPAARAAGPYTPPVTPGRYQWSSGRVLP